MRHLIAVFFLLGSFSLLATHIVGGEMYYRQTGPGSYRVFLKIYRDCGPANTNNTQFDSPAHVGIYQNGNLVSELDISQPVITTLPVNPVNPCLSAPPDICIQEAVYTADILLAASPDDYYIVYQRCCRSPVIINLITPEDYGLSLFTVVPGSGKASVNSSPYYRNLMPLVFCISDEVVFDHSAVDEDGDSLVYGLTAPYTGGTSVVPQPNPPSGPPYTKVPWNTGYDDNYPIDSDPQIRIDPRTGELTLKPIRQGTFCFGVYVSEYRNGVFLATSIRDYQFNVVNCSYGISSTITPQTEFCKGLDYAFSHANKAVRILQWRFGDFDNPLGIDSIHEPEFTFPDTGHYPVYLITTPGYQCADTLMLDFYIKEALEIKVDLDSPAVQCIVDNSFVFRAGGTFLPGASIDWQFFDGASIGASSGLQVNNVTYNSPGWKRYEVFVRDLYCENTYRDSVKLESVDVLADFATQDTFCTGTVYTFRNLSSNTSVFNWDFGFPGGSSSQEHPVITFPDTGNFRVMLVAGPEYPCIDTVFKDFYLSPDFSISFDVPDTACFNGNALTMAVSSQGLPVNQQIYWEITDYQPFYRSLALGLSNLGFQQTGTKIFNARVSAYGCDRSAADTLVLVANPSAVFSPVSAAGCVPLQVRFECSVPYDYPCLYNWDTDTDDVSGDVAVFDYTYTDPGTYFPSLTLVSLYGCRDTVRYDLAAGITAHALPPLSFRLLEDSGKIETPLLQVRSGLTDNSRAYFTLDGDFLTSSPEIDFNGSLDAGLHRITQINESPMGCIDSISAPYTVTGYLIFTPNAFTADGDGYNDYFLPKVSASREFEYVVFNRWGEVIYRGDRNSTGWDGTISGRPCPDGIYPYTIHLVSFEGESREMHGHVLLIR